MCRARGDGQRDQGVDVKPRLYDSGALAKIGTEVHGFRGTLDAALESMRMDRLKLTEETAWKLVRRFVGPRCPAAAEDALTCVNLMGAEMVCIDHRDGASIFVIRRGIEHLDSEQVPDWRRP